MLRDQLQGRLRDLRVPPFGGPPHLQQERARASFSGAALATSGMGEGRSPRALGRGCSQAASYSDEESGGGEGEGETEGGRDGGREGGKGGEGGREREGEAGVERARE